MFTNFYLNIRRRLQNFAYLTLFYSTFTMNSLHDLVNKSLDIEIVKSPLNSVYSTVMSIPYCTYSTVHVIGDTVNRIGGTVNDTVHSINGTVHSIGEAVHSKVNSVRGTVHSKVNSISGTVNSTVNSVGGTLSDTLGKLYGFSSYVPRFVSSKETILNGHHNGTIKEEDEDDTDDDDDCPTAVSNGFVTNGVIANGSIHNDAATKHATCNGAMSNGIIKNGSVTNGAVVGGGLRMNCDDKRLKPVTFEWLGNDRDKVSITGTFYDWTVKLPLNKRSKKFAAQIDLPKGRHEFKFVINGVWKHSPNYPTVANDFGEVNNYVDVH